MKRILFIYPPSRPILREDRCPVPSGNPVMSPRLPPTDLMYLASIAESRGYECMIRDYSGKPDGISLFISDLKSFRPCVLFVNVTTPTFIDDIKSCVTARSILPELRIIIKGAHLLRYDVEVMMDVPEVDIVVRGEAEFAFGEILADKPLKDIKGITWRENGRVLRNPDRDHERDDVDSLPPPSRHLVNNSHYKRPDNGMPLGVIRVSRGCPHGCFFCLATPVYGRKVRMRSVQSVVDEISKCIRDYGINNFIFWSDLFNASSQWVSSLCEEIIRKGIKIQWSANIRADRFNEEMALLMKRAGCELLSVGVESGSQDILNRVGKNIALEDYVRAFVIMKKTGIRSIAYYILGLPWESRESANKTMEFSRRLDSDFANFYVFAPLPGTAGYEYVINEALAEESALIGGALKNAYYSAVCSGHYMSKDEINALRKEAIRAFYFRAGYAIKRLREIDSFDELKNYIRAVFSMLKMLPTRL